MTDKLRELINDDYSTPNGFNQKKYNYNSYRLGLASPMTKRLVDKMSAYCAKNEISYKKVKEWLLEYDEDDFDKFIKNKYAIKGEVTWEKIMKAKLKTEVKESEHEIQVKVCKYLKERKIGHWAVPNGFVHNGDKIGTARYINYMKAEGVKNGVPDITICYGDGKVAFLEIKTPTGKPSEYQLNWLKWFNNNGYKAKICYGYDECIMYIDELMESEK